MSNASFVDEAASKVAWMVARETRCPGDTKNAMHRLSRRYGIGFGTLWNLRYRKPKDLFTSIYFAVQTAYEAECDRQQRLLDAERASTQAKTKLGLALLGEVSPVARQRFGDLSNG